MKELTAKPQVRLGLARCFRLALSGMSHRLFRAGVTIAILALAVAFLAHMLAFSVVERETQRSAWNELRASRQLGEIITRASNVDTSKAIIDGLAGDDPSRLHEYRLWSGATAEQFQRARAAAVELKQFDAYLANAGAAQRAALFGDETTTEACATLAEPGQLARFSSQLHSFGLRAPFGDEARLKSFVIADLPVLSESVQAIAQGHAGAIARLQARFSSNPEPLFERPPAGLLDAARGLGFDTSVWSLPALTAFALRESDRARLERAIVSDPARAELARELDVPSSDVSLSSVLGYVDGDSTRATAVSAILTRGGAAAPGGAALGALAREFVRAERVERAAGSDARASVGWFGISARSSWLVLLSFLVCGIGVANAMLMSVGERFAEIATMKCLGALDGFVMTLFLFEAVIQGVIGGVIGLVLGALLALGHGFAEYGALLGSARGAAGTVLLALGVALVLGVLLAALSAIGPSFVAARLSPMEAMRVD
jgi:putative ABC transport system permease protein